MKALTDARVSVRRESTQSQAGTSSSFCAERDREMDRDIENENEKVQTRIKGSTKKLHILIVQDLN